MAESSKVLEVENAASLLSTCMESGLGLEAVLTKLSLAAPKELQEGIFQLSSFAAAECLQLIGIGAGFTSLDMQGFALAQINKQLDEIKEQISTILGAPAIAAFEFLQRGIQSLEAEDYGLAYEEFKKVVDHSIQGRIYQKEKLQTVANLSRYVIFADLMIGTYIRASDLFAPYELLEHKKKLAIKAKVTQHLEKLLDTQKKQKLGLFFRGQTKEANQNLVDSVLKTSLQFVCPPGEPVPLRFVPDGVEDAALLNLDGKPGRVDASAVYIYKKGTNVIILHHCDKKEHMANIDCGQHEELLVNATKSGLTIDNSAKEVKSTDLIEASIAGNRELVSLLVQHPGVQLNQRDQDGFTPLHLAALHGHLDVTRKLLAAGADPTPVANNKYTPLHYAARGGHLDVTRKLLAAGADPTPVANNKCTPLHYAAFHGHLDMARDLVAAGADHTAVDSDGKTPAQYAKIHGHMDVFNYLTNCK